MDLVKIMNNSYIALIGNRFSAIGASLFLGSYGSIMIAGPSIENFILANVGGFLVGVTHAGLGTLNMYKRTLESIERNGKLNSKFVRRIAEDKDSVKSLVGYCQIQGMYLAARERNQLHVFYKGVNRTENKIPNF